jgi:hypothetical protein
LVLGLMEVKEVVGEFEHEAFQLGNDFLVHLFEQSLLDGGQSLECTHR